MARRKDSLSIGKTYADTIPIRGLNKMANKIRVKAFLRKVPGTRRKIRIAGMLRKKPRR